MRNQIEFKDLKEGDHFECYGDIHLNYNSRKICKCIKLDELTAREIDGIIFNIRGEDTVFNDGEKTKGSFYSDDYINRLKAEYFEKGLKAKEPQKSEIPELSMNQITNYQYNILTMLNDHYSGYSIGIGRGDRLLFNGKVVSGFLVNDVRNKKDYDNDLKYFIDEIERQIISKL